MSSKLQSLDYSELRTMTAAAAGAPSGDVGLEMATGMRGALRPSLYAITVVVTVAPADVLMYGCIMHLGAVDTPADDQWGLVNDRYKTVVNGVLGTALAIGTHHFVVEDLGIFGRLYFTKSAGTVNVFVRPLIHGGRGN